MHSDHCIKELMWLQQKYQDVICYSATWEKRNGSKPYCSLSWAIASEPVYKRYYINLISVGNWLHFSSNGDVHCCDMAFLFLTTGLFT